MNNDDLRELPTHASCSGARRVLLLLWRRLYDEDGSDAPGNRALLDGLLARIAEDARRAALFDDQNFKDQLAAQDEEGVWESCSGCTKLGDHMSGSHRYKTHPSHGCLVGVGCSECNWRGVVLICADPAESC
jgi:hypothetical protein